MECVMDSSDMEGFSGITRSIDATSSQLTKLKEMFNKGEIISGEAKLYHGRGVSFDKDKIFIGQGLDVASSVSSGKAGGNSNKRRHLANTLGDKSILTVR